MNKVLSLELVENPSYKTVELKDRVGISIEGAKYKPNVFHENPN